MHKKILTVLAIALTFTIVVGIGTIVSYFQPDTATAKSIEPVLSLNENSAVTNVVIPINSQDAMNIKYPLSQKVNGIKMDVTGTAIDGEYFTADVCYDLPKQKTDYAFTLGGQTQSSITLTNTNETIPIYSWEIISGSYEDANGGLQRHCARLYFPISPSTNLDDLMLSISRMSTPIADIPDCASAQKKLDDTKQDITVNCDNGGFTISEKTADMDDARAWAIAFDAFLDIVEGPWIFKLK